MSTSAEPYPDVVVVGGGVIGLSIAYFLSADGTRVTVLDQGHPGQEASWAGAGMLPPGNLHGAVQPAARLRAYSHNVWKTFSQELRESTGIDNGYVVSGSLELGLSDDDERLAIEAGEWTEEGVAIERFTGDGLRRIEPALSGEVEGGYRLSQLAQIRNPRHLRALIAASRLRGVKIVAGAPVTGFLTRRTDSGSNVILAARTNGQDYPAAKFVIAGGAWTPGILSGLDIPNVKIYPVRGQIVLLSVESLPFRHILNHGPRYLVPRPDGRILVGSTQENVGFEKRNTAEGVAGLLQFAQRLVPTLSGATLERMWAGLRPGSPQGNPTLGQLPGFFNGFVAAGHFRSGLQLSAGTGKLMAQLVNGGTPEIDLDAFQVNSKLSPGKPS